MKRMRRRSKRLSYFEWFNDCCVKHNVLAVVIILSFLNVIFELVFTKFSWLHFDYGLAFIIPYFSLQFCFVLIFCFAKHIYICPFILFCFFFSKNAFVNSRVKRIVSVLLMTWLRIILLFHIVLSSRWRW